MNLSDIKPLGAFIENTIRPILSEFSELLKEFERQGVKVTEDNIVRVVKQIAGLHLRTVILQGIRDVFIAIIAAWVLWTIYR